MSDISTTTARRTITPRSSTSPRIRRVARTTLSLGALAGACWLTAAPYVWMF